MPEQRELKIDCDICGNKLEEQGSLIFSPPKVLGQLMKFHIYLTCWTPLKHWIHTGNFSRPTEPKKVPCPKCGGTSLDMNAYSNECFYIICDDCDYCVEGGTQEECIKEWKKPSIDPDWIERVVKEFENKFPNVGIVYMPSDSDVTEFMSMKHQISNWFRSTLRNLR